MGMLQDRLYPEHIAEGGGPGENSRTVNYRTARSMSVLEGYPERGQTKNLGFRMPKFNPKPAKPTPESAMKGLRWTRSVFKRQIWPFFVCTYGPRFWGVLLQVLTTVLVLPYMYLPNIIVGESLLKRQVKGGR